MGLPFSKGNYAMNKKTKNFYVKKMQKYIIVGARKKINTFFLFFENFFRFWG